MKKNELRIALAQLTFCVGDLLGNTKKIIDACHSAYGESADVCVFPELALCGYPPEDLLWLPDFKANVEQSIKRILEASKGMKTLTIMFGFPHYVEKKIFNAMAVIKNGEMLSTIHKQCLPNKGVFEELRYFSPGTDTKVFSINEIKLGLLICEDIWHDKPATDLRRQHADLTIVINASPYALDKPEQRQKVLAKAAEITHAPVLYLNHFDAQDDLIFDGGACYLNDNGQILWQGHYFQEGIYVLDLKKERAKVVLHSAPPITEKPTDEALMYQALVFGLRQYVVRNKIGGVVIGLSGGIDSALVLAIAVDAIGADKVTAVALPSRNTADISTEYAKQQALAMGVEFKIIDIDGLYEEFLTLLKPHFKHLPKDTTEENIQSRCRGSILMALANKYHYILLNTSNKSELAVGYGTLYGDMIGAYSVLKDVLKKWVYRLSHYRNGIDPVIPQEVIDRAPTAELAPNQKDQDSLPPYPVLDEIIERYVEKQQSVEEIVKSGISKSLARSIINKINANEYKRRQGPVGPKVSNRAFTRERHYPITSEFNF